MSSRTFRVTVRGMFDQLTGPQLAVAAEHAVFHTADDVSALPLGPRGRREARCG